MTSIISFSKMTWDEMKKLTWLTAVQGLVFFMLIPFRVLMVLASRSSQQFFVENPDELVRLFHENVGLATHENLVFVMAAGALCALIAFGYLHSPVKLDFYHSLPVTRERLFTSKLFGSSLTFIFAYVCSQILAILMGLLYGVVSGGVVAEITAATVQGILCFFCSYAGTLLAVMLTGRLLTTILAAGVLGLYFPMLILLDIMCREIFLKTSLGGYNRYNMPELCAYSSPWAFCFSRLENYDGQRKLGITGFWPDAASLCQMAALAVILLLICAALYRIRRTEVAGNALAFRKTEGIIKILLAVPGALVAAAVAYEMFESVLWEIVFILVFGALGCVLMEFIYRGDIRQSLCHKIHAAVTVVIAAAIFFSFRFDVTGYNSYLPAKEDVQAMAVKVGFWDYTYSIDGKLYRSYDTADADRKILDYLETEEFDQIYRLAENGVANVDVEDSDAERWYVAVKYHQKDGKEIYRSYWVDATVFYPVMNELQKDREFREKYSPILTWDDSYIDGLHNCYVSVDGTDLEAVVSYPEDTSSDTLPESVGVPAVSEAEMSEEASDIYTADVTGDTIRELIEAYRMDLEQVTYEDMVKSMGNLEFDHYVDGDITARYSYEIYPISDKFTNVMKILREIKTQGNMEPAKG